MTVLRPGQHREAVQEMCRRSPAQMASALSRGRFKIPRHIRLLSNLLRDAAEQGDARIIVSMPPRHGKSETVSVWTPPWFLARWPDRRVAVASYGAALSTKFGRRARNIVAEHGAMLGLELAADSSAADRWDIKGREGGFIAVGVGGPFTGHGADLMVIDDPVKDAREAFSPTVRQSIWDWWLSTASTRLEPGGSVVVVMTRWHDDDLAGRLIKEGRETGEPWTEIRLEAICESEADPLGREEGEALWPERYPAERLAKRRARGDWEWHALYQQRPLTSVGTSPLTSDDIHFWTTMPDLRTGELVQSWDTSFKGLDPTQAVKSSKRSRTAGLAALVTSTTIYLLDRECEHMDFAQQEAALKKMRETWPRTVRTYIEDEANGAALISRLSTELTGLIPIIPKASKFLRLAAVSGFFKSKNILLPPREVAPWVDGFVKRLCAFPNVEFDDDIDALSQLAAEELLPKDLKEESTEDRLAGWAALAR